MGPWARLLGASAAATCAAWWHRPPIPTKTSNVRFTYDEAVGGTPGDALFAKRLAEQTRRAEEAREAVAAIKITKRAVQGPKPSLKRSASVAGTVDTLAQTGHPELLGIPLPDAPGQAKRLRTQSLNSGDLNEPQFTDKVITCEGFDGNQECAGDKTFTWTASEQKFYADQKLFAPKRCPTCRKRRIQTLPARSNLFDKLQKQCRSDARTWHDLA